VTPQEIADAASMRPKRVPPSCICTPAIPNRPARPEPGSLRAVLKNHKQRSNCVINLTTGGAPTMTVDERVRPRGLQARGRLAHNGSMNFAFFGMLNRFKKFEHDWELKICRTRHVFRNTFQDIEYVLKTCRRAGTRFEFEWYDTAHLLQSQLLPRTGPRVKAALIVQTCSACRAHRGSPEDVLHMNATAVGCSATDGLVGARRRRNQLPIGAMAAAMGGNVASGWKISRGARPHGGIERRTGTLAARSSRVSV